jgi:integral membrane protein (TIGR01906 family)
VKLLRTLAAALFVAAIFLGLLLTNVRIVATQPLVYEYSFSRYDVVEQTRVERSDLDRAAREIVAYFGSGHVADLIINVAVAGETQSLFNEREILHMRDVRALFQGSFFVQELALIYVVGYAVVLAVQRRRQAVGHIARLTLGAGALTVGVLTTAALAFLVAFHWLFTQFHLISFSNDFWKLNPRTDRLVQMFPDGFWFDVSMGVGLITIAQGILIAVVAYLLLRRQPDFAASTLFWRARSFLLGC